MNRQVTAPAWTVISIVTPESCNHCHHGDDDGQAWSQMCGNKPSCLGGAHTCARARSLKVVTKIIIAFIIIIINVVFTIDFILMSLWENESKCQIRVEQRYKSANPGSAQWASAGGELFWDRSRFVEMGLCLRLVEMVGKILLNGPAQDVGFPVNFNSVIQF